jgi:hypothetical protein
MFDGKVIAEEYAAGGGPDRLQMLASGSKSFVGVAAATYRRFDATDDMPTSPRLSACPAPSVPREPTLSASSQRCGLIEAPSATNTLRPTYEKGQAND